MFRAIAASGLLCVLTSVASAQTIYEPVQFQYGSGADTFYYGGNDPAVFDYAERLNCLRNAGRDASGGFDLDSPNHAYLHPGLTHHPDAVYSDCAPYLNASVYGFTRSDARNEAYLNVPRYFRKIDLLAAAAVLPDGTRVVPAQAQPIRVIDRASDTKPAQRGVILIIPKKALRVPARTVAQPVVRAD